MTFTTPDAWSGLLYLSFGLLIIGLLIAVGIVSARRQGRTTLALDVTGRFALIWVILSGVGVVFVAFQSFGATIILDEPVSTWATGQADVSCEFPVATSSPAFECGGAVEGAPFGPRLLVFVGTALMLAASATIAWALHVAARRVAEGSPFADMVARSFTIAAAVVLPTTIVGGLLRQIGMTLVARSVPAPDDMPSVPFILSIPLWPFAVALGLFALAAIFRHGARLQRETEGLV